MVSFSVLNYKRQVFTCHCRGVSDWRSLDPNTAFRPTFLAVDDKVSFLVSRGDLVGDAISIRVLGQNCCHQSVGTRILGDESSISDRRHGNTESTLYPAHGCKREHVEGCKDTANPRCVTNTSRSQWVLHLNLVSVFIPQESPNLWMFDETEP